MVIVVDAGEHTCHLRLIRLILHVLHTHNNIMTKQHSNPFRPILYSHVNNDNNEPSQLLFSFPPQALSASVDAAVNHSHTHSFDALFLLSRLVASTALLLVQRMRRHRRRGSNRSDTSTQIANSCSFKRLMRMRDPYTSIAVKRNLCFLDEWPLLWRFIIFLTKPIVWASYGVWLYCYGA